MKKFTKKQIEQWNEDQEIEGFEIVFQSLTSPSQIDPYDSNEFEVVFKDKKDGKFYRVTYDEWPGSDMEIEDFSSFKEVFPVEETRVVYK